MTDEPWFNTIERFASRGGGVLLVDKPREWTSFDVVKKLRNLLHVKKVGHAGTLDPIATGLLILCSNSMTKRIETFQALRKTYEGRMYLGAVTPSYDAATPMSTLRDTSSVTEEALQAVFQRFSGTISQIPPMFSALKIGGQRLYKLARKGIEVERQPRQVEIYSFRFLGMELPHAHFRVECSKGTYVRSLVHDVGQNLGCGAFLDDLRRTAIGAFTVEEAWKLTDIMELATHSPQEMKGYDEGQKGN